MKDPSFQINKLSSFGGNKPKQSKYSGFESSKIVYAAALFSCGLHVLSTHFHATELHEAKPDHLKNGQVHGSGLEP